MKNSVNPLPVSSILMVLVMALAMVIATGAMAENGTAGGQININSADTEQLAALPAIGPTKAQAIVRYRTEHGPFLTVENLADVRGIGSKVLEKILHLVTIQDQ